MLIVQRISQASMVSYNANPCSSFSLYNVSLSDCIAGMLDGQEKAASLTEPYKIGFAQGKNDYLILPSYNYFEILVM
jgi:hypothetical protein